MVYDRSMKMDGPCAMYRCMTDGKLENVSFFFGFFALVGLLPAGVMYKFFDICSVYFYPSINITRIKIHGLAVEMLCCSHKI